MPTGAHQHVEEPAEHENGGDAAQDSPRLGRASRGDDLSPWPPRRPLHESRLGRLAAQRERGERLGAEVDGQDLQYRQRQRDGPPESAKTRNGTTSGVAWAKM